MKLSIDLWPIDRSYYMLSQNEILLRYIYIYFFSLLDYIPPVSKLLYHFTKVQSETFRFSFFYSTTFTTFEILYETGIGKTLESR